MLNDDQKLEVMAALKARWRMRDDERAAIVADLEPWDLADVLRSISLVARSQKKRETPTPMYFIGHLPKKTTTSVYEVPESQLTLVQWCKKRYQIGMDAGDIDYLEAHVTEVSKSAAAYTYKQPPAVTFREDGSERRTRPFNLVPLDEDDAEDVKMRVGMSLRADVVREMVRLGCNVAESLKWVDDLFAEVGIKLPPEGSKLDEFRTDVLKRPPKRIRLKQSKQVAKLEKLMAKEEKS